MARSSQVEGRTPVLVGIGVASQREDDPLRAKDALSLMLEAARRAGVDAEAPTLLAEAEQVYVPKGRWKYADPGRYIAKSIGAARARSILSTVGVLQQTLIGSACAAISRGEIGAALVIGGDAGYRILRCKIGGVEPQEPHADGTPDTLLAPKEELRHPAELRAGMRMPVGLYAMIESAFRARHGWSVLEHRARLGALYSRFSAIAAENPQSWTRQTLEADAVNEASERNPMQAFPYTRRLCSSWNVDQAAALLFCSVEMAECFAIPKQRWIFPWASSESNHMVPVSARAELDRCPGAYIAGSAALGETNIRNVDLIELYSCFPVAVETYAEALGIQHGKDLTVTGGMSFAGGPYNNYVLQATARMGELLRQGRGRTGLIGSVSGVLTKQGFGLFSTEPAANGFRFADVSDEVARATATKEVVVDANGAGRIAGFSVLFDGGLPAKGVAIVNLADGRRTVANTEHVTTIGTMLEHELCGAQVLVEGAQFRLTS